MHNQKLTLEKDGNRRVGRGVGIAGTLLLLASLLALRLFLVGLGRGGNDCPGRYLLLPGRYGSHPSALADQHVGKGSRRWRGDRGVGIQCGTAHGWLIFGCFLLVEGFR